jgi:hypothetical protein
MAEQIAQRGNPNWVKGGPSPNPNGRPRSGFALAEAIREKLDPRSIAEMLEAFRSDTGIPIERRLTLLLPWAHAGYLRPPQSLELNLGGREDEHDLSRATDVEIQRLTELEDERTRILAAIAARDIGTTDGYANRASSSTIESGTRVPALTDGASVREDDGEVAR